MTRIMPSIIDRYILVEIFKVFAAVLITVVVVSASMLLLRTLEEVNTGALGTDMVLRFLALQVLRNIPSLLPPVFFIAVLAALGRMARDSELIALGACGLGPGRIYRALLYAAVPVTIMTAWISFDLRPAVMGEIYKINAGQADRVNRIVGLRAGRFYQEGDGQVTIYVGKIDDDGSLHNIFIHDQRAGEMKLVLSDHGLFRRDEVSGEQFVTLLQGRRFDGIPGRADYTIGEFDRYNWRIEPRKFDDFRSEKRSAFRTADLLRANDLLDRAELQYRFSGPIAILTLTILTVPLTTTSPRQRGTWRMFLAFLTYFSLFNLQRVAAHWYETGVTPAWIGSLWYLAVILVLVFVLLLPDSRWLRSLRRRPAPLGGMNAPCDGGARPVPGPGPRSSLPPASR
jgi:lipopolysaccharide export system permease protein